MLWRLLWKIHVATVRWTKASLCNAWVSQNCPHPLSSRNHCSHCAGLTAGQQNQTGQRGTHHRQRELGNISAHGLANCRPLTLIWKLPQSREDFGTKLLIGSAGIWGRYDGTHKTSLKSERAIRWNWGETHQTQRKAANSSSPNTNSKFSFFYRSCWFTNE